MKQLTTSMQKQFDKMCQTGKLFRVKTNNLWEFYLNSFESDPKFRDPQSSTHNCNTCHNFIKRYGDIVAINSNYEIMTIWDVTIGGEFALVTSRMSNLLKQGVIEDIFIESYNTLNEKLNYEKCKKTNSIFRLGIDVNYKKYTGEEVSKYGVVNTTDIYVFNHLFLDVPKQFVDFSNKSIESILSNFRTDKEVFKRGLDTIGLETLELIVELSNQGSLLNMDSHIHKVKEQIKMSSIYATVDVDKKDNWCWVHSHKYQYAKFRNELIGAFALELQEDGVEKACLNWNKRVDSVNFMKAVAPITETQRKFADNFVVENGYVESFSRRVASIDDVKASEILHINSNNNPKTISLFDGLVTKSNVVKVDKEKLNKISIDTLIKDVIPNSNTLELYLENKFEGNLVNMTTTNSQESKPMFKYPNNYSITYKGGLAGKSQIRQAVESRGGKTEGVVNIRLAFPNTESDYDLHIGEPNGGHISYSNRRQVQRSSGMLDLDAQGADGNFPSEKRVENVIYTDASKMPIGKYRVYVNNYSKRDDKFGFDLEIEIGGNVTSFKYEKFIPSGDNVTVCYIEYDGKDFNILPSLPISDSNVLSKELWGLSSNKFHKVNLFCLSPNHWDETQVGNKHYLFFLDDCKNNEKIRAFHNEDLNSELLAHRKVLDALGNKILVEPLDNQLAGVGFNATVKEEFVIKANNRMYLVTI